MSLLLVTCPYLGCFQCEPAQPAAVVVRVTDGGLGLALTGEGQGHEQGQGVMYHLYTTRGAQRPPAVVLSVGHYDLEHYDEILAEDLFLMGTTKL